MLLRHSCLCPQKLVACVSPSQEMAYRSLSAPGEELVENAGEAADVLPCLVGDAIASGRGV